MDGQLASDDAKEPDKKALYQEIYRATCDFNNYFTRTCAPQTYAWMLYADQQNVMWRSCLWCTR